MTPQETYKTLENDCFNLLTVDPNPPHDLNHFSLILGLENTHGSGAQCGESKTGDDYAKFLVHIDLHNSEFA